MGRDLQKKKRRSSRAVIRQPNKSKQLLNPTGNRTIAKHWNKDETMTQNYRRLGLMARLKAPTGGSEKFTAAAAAVYNLANDMPPTTASAPGSGGGGGGGGSRNVRDPFDIATTENSVVTEAFVDRDVDGNITAVRHAGPRLGGGSGSGNNNNRPPKKKYNPLNDPLVDLESDSDAGGDWDDEDEDDDDDDEDDNDEDEDDDDLFESWPGFESEGDFEDDGEHRDAAAIVRQLEDGVRQKETAFVRQLEAEAAAMVQPPKPRKQSPREQQWLKDLFEKHGDDTRAMFRDRRMNPMQQTEADIAGRLKKWKKANRML